MSRHRRGRASPPDGLFDIVRTFLMLRIRGTTSSGTGQPNRYRPVADSEVQVQHGSDGVHLPVGIPASVKLVGEVLFEFDTAVERNCRSADPLRPAPRIKPAVV